MPSPDEPSLFTRLGRWGDRQLLRSRPEWDLFPSEETRLEAVEALDRELEHSNRFWGTVVLVVLGVIGLLFMITEILQRVVPTLPGWFQVALNLPGLLIGYAAVVWVWRAGVVRRLRRKLIELGVPVCRRCGYALQGIDAERCPECGGRIDERLRAMMRGEAPPS